MAEYKTLSINNAESISSIEDEITKLLRDDEFKIRLPARLNSAGAIGVEVSVIQFIGTWLKHGKYKKIFHSHQEDNFKNLCSSIYGIVILCLADEIISTGGDVVPKWSALQSAKDIIENLRAENYVSAFKSHYFGVPCIKKPSYDREFSVPFYNGDQVIDSDAFFHKIKKIIDVKVGVEKRISKIDSIININHLSEILWELFKNTHDHGREYANGNEIPLNFRGILLQQQDITDDYLEVWLGKSPTNAQNKFVDSLVKFDEKYHILDLSVVDFGSGFLDMAKNKLGILQTEDEIKGAVLKCFEKGWSRLPKSNRGSGLTKVLQCIHNYGGWFRVRTGNILIEKVFSAGSNPVISMEDITIVNGTVAGTAIHISLPLNSPYKIFGGIQNV